MLGTRLRKMQMLAAGAGLSLLLATTGCGAFFQCEGKADCGTGSTSTGTGDYVYVSNSTTGSTYINGYQIGSGTLTAISGMPVNLGYEPIAMAVSQNNDFLYVAAQPGTADSGIWMYTIGSGGVISGGTQETNTEVGAMALSPDGNWLYTIDSGTGSVLSQYSLNTSSGALGTASTIATPGGSQLVGCAVSSATPASQSCSVAVSPEENYVAVALNTNGAVVFPYSSSGGITSSAYTTISALNSASGDYSLAFDSSSYLYIASTSALTSYGSSNYGTAVSSYTGYSSDATPRSVTLSTSSNYVFTADEGTNDIQEFTVSGGIPSAFATPYVLGPSSVSALGADRSGTYLLAAGYNTTNGLQMFSIASTGITAVTSEGTGATTSIPVVMALTH